MDLSEREFLVFRIRSGVYKVLYNKFNIKILTPTIEDELEACEVYDRSYYEAINDDIMTQEECFEWMIEDGIWTYEEDLKIKEINKEIENLKVNVYKKYNNTKLRESARIYLRAAEEGLAQLENRKNAYYGNTCEGIAQLDKSMFLLESCSYVGGQRLDPESVELNSLLNKYYSLILKEADSREIARSDPWRSIWSLKDTNTFNIFSNTNRELSVDQRNLLIWSRMYENIQESMECPSDEVIKDDDALDGWFIEQRRKNEREKAIGVIEDSMQNDKIRNSHEVLVFADNKKDAETIHEMNSPNSKMIKKQRQQVIKERGSAVDLDFADQKMRVGNMAHEKFKNNFRR
jgi:hypothetical protein|tara:strand:+ start:145 stop:1185 length:1041 start_codon:yes stop_codon:yes gene_type:complete